MEGPIGQQTISPLQLMQARFQRKLLQDKQQMMMQLYPEGNNSHHNLSKKSSGEGGGTGTMKTKGGAVRQFFAQRRTNNTDDIEALKSTGLISLQQSLNGTWPTSTFGRAAPKHGSPVGWDKSYPLSPLDRDSSGGSSSGYDSGNAVGSPYLNPVSHKKTQKSTYNAPSPGHRIGAQPGKQAVKKPTKRTPSLDRYKSNAQNKWNQQPMRRSSSQILVSNNKEKENEAQTHPLNRSTQKKKPAMLSHPPKYSSPPPPPLKMNFEEMTPVKSVQKSKKPVVPAIEPKQNKMPLPPSKPVGPSPKRSPAAGNVDPNLVECHICGRRFAADRIDKHTTVCEKTKSKKRKVFDPTKMRTQGTELEEYIRNPSAKHQPEPQPKKDWRVKRNNFIEALRQAKVVQKHLAAGGKVSDLPPPPPMDTSDYLQCPYCDRKFSEGAAERHIPKCQNIKSNKRAERK